MMPEFTVKVKWGKKLLKNVPLNTEGSVSDFRGTLLGLTGVPTARQKLMGPGIKGMLKNTVEWGSVKTLKNGYTFKLMGTADEAAVVAAVSADTIKVPKKEQKPAPVGFSNLGNTCYANASLQCLRSIPGLREALRTKGGPLAKSLARTLDLADLNPLASDNGFAPIPFLNDFRQKFPQFLEAGPQGPLQHDAEEFWTLLLSSLDGVAPHELMTGGSSKPTPINDLFRGRIRSTLTSVAGDTPDVKEETFTKLSCHMDSEVSMLSQGLDTSMGGSVEKHSGIVGGNTVWNRQAQISELPKFLTVQFVRFFYNRKTQKRQKILRKVSFPHRLDMRRYLSDELGEQVDETRQTKQIIRDALDQARREAVKAGEEPPPIDEDDGSDELEATATAEYELVGVVTHRGRSAEGGHYLGWARDADGQWWKYDDESVHQCTPEEVSSLSGGGDWHTAYLCVYKAKVY